MPKKSHTISGNKRFMTKRAIPILKKYGIKNVKAAERGGFFLELTFDIDDAKLQKLDKELKKANKSAYGGVLEQIKKIIREEIQKLNEGIDLQAHYHRAKSHVAVFDSNIDGKRGGSFDTDSYEYEDDRWNNDSKMLKARDKKLGQWEKKVKKTLDSLMNDYVKAWK